MPGILWMKTCRQILIALSAGNLSKGDCIIEIPNLRPQMSNLPRAFDGAAALGPRRSGAASLSKRRERAPAPFQAPSLA